MDDKHKRTRTLTSETQQRIQSILERGRTLPPDRVRDELLGGIELARARIYALNGTAHDELGKTIGLLLDVLIEHMRTGALHFDPTIRKSQE